MATAPDSDFPATIGFLIGELIRPLNARDATAEEEIEACERRLGVALPKGLRQYYALCGNMVFLNRRHNRLLRLDQLWLDGTVLVFFEENQNVVFWGVDALAAGYSTDPPVLQGLHQEPIVWGHDFDFLSDFFVYQVCLQAVHGAMEYTAIADIGPSVAEQIAARWPKFDGLRGTNHSGVSIYRRADQLLWVYGGPDKYTVQAGAGAAGQLPKVADELNIKWLLMWGPGVA